MFFGFLGIFHIFSSQQETIKSVHRMQDYHSEPEMVLPLLSFRLSGPELY